MQVDAIILVSMLGTKIRSNLHKCQYASSLPSDHSQGQAQWKHFCSLVSPDILTSFFVRPLAKGVVDSPSHTSGFNCYWLKVVMAEEVIVFLASCSLCCCDACLSGTVCSGTEQSVQTFASHTRLRRLCLVPKVNPSSLFPTHAKPTCSKVEGRLMGVNDLLGKELVTERLG